MQKDDLIRAAVNVGGLEIFVLAPQLLKDSVNHLDELRIIANSVPYLDRSHIAAKEKLCRKICKKFAFILDAPKPPKGVAVLAIIIEHLTVCLAKNSFSRPIWLKLSKNRRYFIRRRFARLLRDKLTQKEADELWNIWCKKNDYEILRNLILADPSICLPKECLDIIVEMEEQGYLLSRTMAHEINIVGAKSYKRFRKKYPIPAIYAAGFSGRSDLVSELRLIANQNQANEDEYRAAVWALARLGDKKGIFKIVANVFKDNYVPRKRQKR